MSTARQRRLKNRAKHRKALRSREPKGGAFSLRQRVTMEVARRANALGMTLDLSEDAKGIWRFASGPGKSFLSYMPLNGQFWTPFWVGHEPDVRNVLEMAARINNERSAP